MGWVVCVVRSFLGEDAAQNTTCTSRHPTGMYCLLAQMHCSCVFYRVVGQHMTYCDLTVEFTIRVHGMSMGSITTSVTLIVSVIRAMFMHDTLSTIYCMG